MNIDKHQYRKKIRLKNFDYSKNGAYFVTVCVQGKRECLGNIINGQMILTRSGLIVQDTWNKLIDHYDCQLDHFVIMPNHIHGIVIIGRVGEGLKPSVGEGLKPSVGEGLKPSVGEGLKPSVGEGLKPSPTGKKHGLSEIIRGFKTFSSKSINLMDLNNKFRWQRSFYDHVIRDEEDLNRVREYIDNNPLQGELDEENLVIVQLQE